MTFDSIKSAVARYSEEILNDFIEDASYVDITDAKAKDRLGDIRRKHLQRFSDVENIVYLITESEGMTDCLRGDISLMIRDYRKDTRHATRDYIEALLG